MNRWREITLQDIAEINSGFAFKSVEMAKEPGIPLIKIKNINNRSVSKNCDSFLSESFKLPIHQKFILKQGDILIAMTGQGSVGRIGKMHYVDKTYLINQRVGIVRIKEHLADKEFVFQLIANKENEKKYFNLAMGAGQPNLSPKDIGKLKLTIPPLPTQKRIATILSAYDDLIENNLKCIKLLEEIAQRYYEEWFVKFRVNGEQLPMDETTRLPVGWERKRTDEICNFSNGYAYYTKGYSEDGYVILDLGNITENSDLKISGKEKFVDADLYNATKKFHLFKYDVILAMTDVTSALRILGKTAIVDKDNLYALNQRVGCLRSKDDKLDYSTIYALFNDFRFIEKMKAVSKGAVQFYINTKDILEYKHIIPNRDFIDKFTKIYKPILELKMNLKEQNEKLKQSRDILLPRLMSGTINVKS
jgi:type I restriction enzyme S subunit